MSRSSPSWRLRRLPANFAKAGTGSDTRDGRSSMWSASQEVGLWGGGAMDEQACWGPSSFVKAPWLTQRSSGGGSWRLVVNPPQSKAQKDAEGRGFCSSLVLRWGRWFHSGAIYEKSRRTSQEAGRTRQEAGNRTWPAEGWRPLCWTSSSSSRRKALGGCWWAKLSNKKRAETSSYRRATWCTPPCEKLERRRIWCVLDHPKGGGYGMRRWCFALENGFPIHGCWVHQASTTEAWTSSLCTGAAGVSKGIPTRSRLLLGHKRVEGHPEGVQPTRSHLQPRKSWRPSHEANDLGNDVWLVHGWFFHAIPAARAKRIKFQTTGKMGTWPDECG